MTPSPGRLTWNPAAPAPFESGWAIFAKILARNYMAIGELVDLIRKPAVSSRSVYPFNLGNSTWIDFEKFGRLLEIDPARLRTGFLDQLGFRPDGSRCYKIRQCPKCAEFGYHCALFDLAIVKECPWHRCELREACSGCGTSRTLDGNTPFRINGERVCIHCRLRMRPFLTELNLNKLDPISETSIIRYCGEMVDWWRAVREGTCDYPDLVRKLSILAGNIDVDNDLSDILLGYAKAVGPELIYWTLAIEPWSSKYAEWETKVSYEFETSPAPSINSPEGKIYRSIRRHIYRRYVRPHRRCLQALMSLPRSGVFALRGDKVCVAALSYVVWRMSTEGICNIEGLKTPRKADFRLRLMGNPNYLNLSALTRLRWTYLGFFGLWRKLHICFAVEERIRIDFGDDYYCDGFLHWCCDPIEPSSGKQGGDRTAKMKIIYPDPPQDALDSGHLRRGGDSPDGLLDIPAFNSQQTWSWAIGDRSQAKILFQFTYSRWWKKGPFTHVTV